MPVINNGIHELYCGTCTLQHCLVIMGYLRYACRAKAAQGVDKVNRIFVGSARSRDRLFHFLLHSEGT